MSKLGGILDLLGLGADQVRPFTMRGADYFPAGRARSNNFANAASLTPPSEWEITGYDILGNLSDPTLIRPEDIPLNTRLFLNGGDRSMRDRVVTNINGQELVVPQVQEGGPRFADQADRMWASEMETMAKINKAMQDAYLRGENPWFSYVPMARTSSDFSDHSLQTVLEYLASAGGSNRGPSYREDMINGILGENSPLLGGRSISDLSGKARQELTAALDNANVRDATGLDLGPIRFGITDPHLVNANDFGVGYRFAIPERGGATYYDPLNHRSYDGFTLKQPDTNSMTFGEVLPWHIGARDELLDTSNGSDFLNMVTKSGVAPSPFQGRIRYTPTASQLVDQRFVDESSTYLDLLRNQGRAAADEYSNSLLRKMVETRR